MGNNESTGTVKFYNSTKAYGFIIDDNNDKEIFFHVTGVLKDSKNQIAANARVVYELFNDKRGPKAINVKVL